MVGVAAGAAFGVDLWWWDELREAVVGIHPHLPFTLVDDVVVSIAEQSAVAEACGAAVCPVGDVVAGAPVAGAVAARERAAAVPDVQGAAERAGDQAAFPAEVQG